MKKKVLLLVAVLTLLSGCGKTIPTLEDGKEAVVTFKDGSMISVDELYNEMKENYATNLLIDMIDTKILEEEFKNELDDAEEYAKNYIDSLKKYYVDENGNYDEATLLSAIQQYYGYTSIDQFQEGVRINYLRNKAIENYVESIITEKEIDKYYDEEIVGDREVYHIEIIPEVKDTMTDSEKKEAEQAALDEAKAVVAKLKKGEKFEDLAKEYSDDEATKEEGGNLGFINKGTYGSDTFDEEVYSLKVGKYTTTPVKTTNGYEIVYVKSEKDKKELKDVKENIIDSLVKEKLSKDATLEITGMVELRKSHGVDIIDSEINKNFNNYIDRLMLSASQNK